MIFLKVLLREKCEVYISCKKDRQIRTYTFVKKEIQGRQTRNEWKWLYIGITGGNVEGNRNGVKEMEGK
jgi:hypothetical protein